jgi:hypothetical protein
MVLEALSILEIAFKKIRAFHRGSVSGRQIIHNGNRESRFHRESRQMRSNVSCAAYHKRSTVAHIAHSFGIRFAFYRLPGKTSVFVFPFRRLLT